MSLNVGAIVEWHGFIRIKSRYGGFYDKEYTEQGQITSAFTRTVNGAKVRYYSVKKFSTLTSSIMEENCLTLVHD